MLQSSAVLGSNEMLLSGDVKMFRNFLLLEVVRFWLQGMVPSYALKPLTMDQLAMYKMYVILLHGAEYAHDCLIAGNSLTLNVIVMQQKC